MSETAGQRLARMLALVPWLAQHDGVTISDAAVHFDVSEEQLEADLWLVILCGVPGYMPDQLIDIDFWEDGRIRVIEPLTLTRPLRLSHEEALTLLVALRLLAQTPGLPDREAISTASAKLEQSAGVFDIARTIAIDSTVNPDVAQVLSEAGSKVIRIVYGSGSSDSITDRLVEPVTTFNVDGIAYLDAYCHRAQALRTFRLDRIVSAEEFRGAVDPSVESSAAGHNPPDGPGVPALEVTLELAPSARWLVDVHGATVLSREPFRVLLSAHSVTWVVRLVLGLGGAAVVVDPPGLRAAVLEAARKARAQYPGA